MQPFQLVADVWLIHNCEDAGERSGLAETKFSQSLLLFYVWTYALMFWDPVGAAHIDEQN